MAIKKTTTPYEFLVRIDENGIYKGAHVCFLETITENGTVISRNPTSPMPVGDGGFPLEDILSQIQIAALKEVDLVRAERDIAVAENAPLLVQIDALQSQLLAYQTKPQTQTISMRQAQLALLAKGYFEVVDEAIKTMGGSALIEWNKASTVEFDNPLVNQICEMLQLDKAELFDFAKTL